MKIKNTRVYGLNSSIYRSQYPMMVGEPEDFEGFREDNPIISLKESDLKRAKNLAKVPSGSGHDNFMKGIIVQLDIRYTQYLTKQLQRYNWFDYISSQSQMHRLTYCKDIESNCNKYVFEDSYRVLERLIEAYNNNVYPWTLDQFTGKDRIINNKQQCFQCIISNCPMGYYLWTGVTTNYLELKTMYKQRFVNVHKLEEWKYFGYWVESLPMSELITGIKTK